MHMQIYFSETAKQVGESCWLLLRRESMLTSWRVPRKDGGVVRGNTQGTLEKFGIAILPTTLKVLFFKEKGIIRSVFFFSLLYLST